MYFLPDTQRHPATWHHTGQEPTPQKKKKKSHTLLIINSHTTNLNSSGRMKMNVWEGKTFNYKDEITIEMISSEPKI